MNREQGEGAEAIARTDLSRQAVLRGPASWAGAVGTVALADCGVKVPLPDRSLRINSSETLHGDEPMA